MASVFKARQQDSPLQSFSSRKAKLKIVGGDNTVTEYRVSSVSMCQDLRWVHEDAGHKHAEGYYSFHLIASMENVISLLLDGTVRLFKNSIMARRFSSESAWNACRDGLASAEWCRIASDRVVRSPR